MLVHHIWSSIPWKLYTFACNFASVQPNAEHKIHAWSWGVHLWKASQIVTSNMTGLAVNPSLYNPIWPQACNMCWWTCLWASACSFRVTSKRWQHGMHMWSLQDGTYIGVFTSARLKAKASQCKRTFRPTIQVHSAPRKYLEEEIFSCISKKVYRTWARYASFLRKILQAFLKAACAIIPASLPVSEATCSSMSLHNSVQGGTTPSRDLLGSCWDQKKPPPALNFF